VIGLGQLGLHPWEMDEYSMADFALKMEGAKEKEIKEWERVRLLAYITAKPYLKNKNLSIERFMSLPTDKKKEKKEKNSVEDQIKRLQQFEKAKWTKEK
jgi:hypothetical protein